VAGRGLGADQRVVRVVSAGTPDGSVGAAVAKVPDGSVNPAADVPDGSVDVCMELNMRRKSASSSGVSTRGTGLGPGCEKCSSCGIPCATQNSIPREVRVVDLKKSLLGNEAIVRELDLVVHGR
jgi:hypothetical protein